MNGFFLADDLSGALDAAAGFFHAGRRVTVAWGESAGRGGSDGVVGITTETRNASEELAARVVGDAMAQARAEGGRLLYKKIDSTLRGPIVAELRAVMSAWPEARVLFAPANPAAGRTVRNGVLLVRGTPVSETEFARDPVWPARESALRKLLGGLPPERIVIPDIETEADLAGAVTRMEEMGGEWVGVGSGALARAVARKGPGTGDQGPETEVGRRTAEERRRRGIEAGMMADVVSRRSAVLMLCGSAHPANRVQAEQLKADRGVPVCELRMDNAAVAAQEAVAVLRRGGGVSVVVEPTRVESAALLRTIAGVAAQAIVGASVRRSFITGGETAFAVCTALGVKALEFRREIEPGVCLAAAIVRGTEASIAIKPGGFGDAETWVRVWDELSA